MNREAWLTELAESIVPMITEQGLDMGVYTVTLGFPSKRATSAKQRRVGECVYTVKDGSRFLSVSPLLSDEVEIAGVVAHELLHVALGPQVGHKAPFAAAMKPLGLEGKPTATVPGELFVERIKPVLAKLGPLPHSPVDLTDAPKQTTRQLKAVCDLPHGEDDSPYIVRLSKKAMEVGLPICPVHGEPLYPDV